MESHKSPLTVAMAKCCDCGCSCSAMSRSFSGTNLQSVKRKHIELEQECQSNVLGFIIPRIDMENECQALRETVSSQQQVLQELVSELEKERNASSSAANEAMSMILKLQREKAEIEMEARQFQRFTEEKMAHDEEEMTEMEELLYKREHAIEALNCEVQAYKHRLMSYGIQDTGAGEAESVNYEKGISRNNSLIDNLDEPYEIPSYDMYPPLKCKINESHVYHYGDDETDIEKSVYGDTPYSHDQLKDLEYRINQLEHPPQNIQPDSAKNVFEKVIIGQSPEWARHLRKFSADSASSLFGMGKVFGPDYVAESPGFGSSIKKMTYSHFDANSNLKKVDIASEFEDDMSDRVYTIDSIHQGAGAPGNGYMDHKASGGIHGDEYVMTPKESFARDLEIQKLYARLHALEADRETMRQAIISVGTDKAQMVLLKEIAQNLCKEMSPSQGMSSQKHSVAGSSSFMSALKWVLSLILWRRKARQSRYSFGSSPENAGLRLLLDGTSHAGQWRSLSTTKMWY